MLQILVDAIGGDLSSPSYSFKADFDISRSADISVSAYLRTAPGSNRMGNMGNDVLLGRVTFAPHEDTTRMTDEWYAVVGGEGQIRIQVTYKDTPDAPLTIDSFDLLKVIGKGSFGKVMQVRKKDTGRIYAMKTIRKAHIVSRSEVTHTLAERTVLAQVGVSLALMKQQLILYPRSGQQPVRMSPEVLFPKPGQALYALRSPSRLTTADAPSQILCSRTSTEESCSIISNVRGASTKSEAVSTPPSFSVLWSICTCTTSSTGELRRAYAFA